MLATFGSGDSAEKLAALETLTALGPGTIPSLLEPLRSDDAAAPWIAEAVIRWGEPAFDAWPALVERLRRGGGCAANYATAIARLGARTRPLLRAVVASGPDDASLWALDALHGDEGDSPSDLDLLVPLLARESADLRESAALRLGELGPKAAPALPALLRAAQDAKGEVARAAFEAVVAVDPEQHDPRTRELVVRTLGHAEDEDLRRRAAWLLSQHGPPAPEVAAALRAAVADEDPEVAMAAARTLVRWGLSDEPRVVALAAQDAEELEFARHLSPSQPNARKAAVPLLRRVLDAEQEARRLEAVELLIRLGPADPETTAEAMHHARWWDPSEKVKQAARAGIDVLHRAGVPFSEDDLPDAKPSPDAPAPR